MLILLTSPSAEIEFVTAHISMRSYKQRIINTKVQICHQDSFMILRYNVREMQIYIKIVKKL